MHNFALAARVCTRTTPSAALAGPAGLPSFLPRFGGRLSPRGSQDTRSGSCCQVQHGIGYRRRDTRHAGHRTGLPVAADAAGWGGRPIRAMPDIAPACRWRQMRLDGVADRYAPCRTSHRLAGGGRCGWMGWPTDTRHAGYRTGLSVGSVVPREKFCGAARAGCAGRAVRFLPLHGPAFFFGPLSGPYV